MSTTLTANSIEEYVDLVIDQRVFGVNAGVRILLKKKKKRKVKFGRD